MEIQHLSLVNSKAPGLCEESFQQMDCTKGANTVTITINSYPCYMQGSETVNGSPRKEQTFWALNKLKLQRKPEKLVSRLVLALKVKLYMEQTIQACVLSRLEGPERHAWEVSE